MVAGILISIVLGVVFNMILSATAPSNGDAGKPGSQTINSWTGATLALAVVFGLAGALSLVRIIVVSSRGRFSAHNFIDVMSVAIAVFFLMSSMNLGLLSANLWRKRGKH